MCYGILPTSPAYKCTISAHTIISVYPNPECYYMYTYVCTCLTPVHTILHGHQQQGFCSLQDTGSRNGTEPATQYTYVHNYTYIHTSLYIIGPSSPKSLSITRQLQNGIELNWLPPTEPNGEVHYVIYYTPEGGTEQSIDTGSDLTHYNLTGLERNRVYTNIAVQAVNSIGRSVRSGVMEDNYIPTGEY